MVQKNSAVPAPHLQYTPLSFKKELGALIFARILQGGTSFSLEKLIKCEIYKNCPWEDSKIKKEG